jgi:hypothetical protein
VLLRPHPCCLAPGWARGSKGGGEGGALWHLCRGTPSPPPLRWRRLLVMVMAPAHTPAHSPAQHNCARHATPPTCRAGPPRVHGHSHPQGRHQRGHPRLGGHTAALPRCFTGRASELRPAWPVGAAPDVTMPEPARPDTISVLAALPGLRRAAVPGPPRVPLAAAARLADPRCSWAGAGRCLQVTNVESTHYILGSAAGPHPYPMMVRDFQSGECAPAVALGRRWQRWRWRRLAWAAAVRWWATSGILRLAAAAAAAAGRGGEPCRSGTTRSRAAAAPERGAA